eukprot:299929-Prymnesium_polylepis.1
MATEPKAEPAAAPTDLNREQPRAPLEPRPCAHRVRAGASRRRCRTTAHQPAPGAEPMPDPVQMCRIEGRWRSSPRTRASSTST